MGWRASRKLQCSTTKSSALARTRRGGLSTYGDNENYKVDLTWGGSFFTDRLHVVASGLDYYSAGVPKYADRSWTDRGKVAITNLNVDGR